MYALATIGSIHTYGLLPPQRIEITPYPKTSGLPVLSGESPDCPSLRASNEHILIVRVLRARRMVWRLPLPFQACSLSLQGWGLIDLPLRAFSPALPSDCFAIDFPGRAVSPGEGLRRPRVARAQKIISLHPLPCVSLPASPAGINLPASTAPLPLLLNP